MAGRALKRKMLAKLADDAKVAGVTSPEFVYDYIAGGKTMAELAEHLGCSRSYASRHLNADPEIRKALDAARRESAEAMADNMMNLTDEIAARIDAGEDIPPERIAVLKEQNSVKKWLASMNNPDRFAAKDKAIQINIGDLHLDALRKARSQAKVDVIDVTPRGDGE